MCWPAILAKKRKYYQQNCSLVNRFKTIIFSLYVGFILVTAHCYIIRTPSGTRKKKVISTRIEHRKKLSQWHHLFDCTPSPRMSLFVFFFIDSPLLPGHVKYFFNNHIYMTLFDICMICDMFFYINLWLFLCVKVISWVN